MYGQPRALLGQWVDIVGQHRFGPRGGGGGGGAFRGRGGFDHRRFGGFGGFGFDGYPFGYALPYYGDYGYGYDDQAIAQQAAYMAAQMLAQQQQMQQMQQLPPAGPPPGPAPGGGRGAGAPATAAAGAWYPHRFGWGMLPGPGLPPLPPLGGYRIGADLGDAGFEPRAALVDAPPPTEADRWILPMSTGVPILPTQSAQITGRPQARAYKCTSYKISNGGTAGGAADWIVNDLKVGNRSQFVQSGDVPGDVFATNAVDSFIRFETAQTAMDVVVVVTYIGLNESGVPFFSAMFGTAAV